MAEQFIDEAVVSVHAGAGGDGCVAWRREKFVPRGGPAGGDGGKGGDVAFVADPGLATLRDQKYQPEIRAERGGSGGGNQRTGADGADAVIRVPVGTVVRDPEAPDDAAPLADLAAPGVRYVAARGGRGGRGNARFATATRQTPDFATPGEPGESRRIRLSLKLLADVGLVGLPNAGKSTLLRRISEAKPRVADYPFTTLHPHLGVVHFDERRFVVADIPGLIEGASEGVGLGDRFLRHVERTRLLVHLLDGAALLDPSRDVVAEYDVIRRELAAYSSELTARRELVLLNKIDLLPDRAAVAPVVEALERRGRRVLLGSGVSGAGIPELVRAMALALAESGA
jgi:GTP-binding protein